MTDLSAIYLDGTEREDEARALLAAYPPDAPLGPEHPWVVILSHVLTDIDDQRPIIAALVEEVRVLRAQRTPDQERADVVAYLRRLAEEHRWDRAVYSTLRAAARDIDNGEQHIPTPSTPTDAELEASILAADERSWGKP